ncbi:MAG: hypothetical protein ACRBDL_10115 [Alphaproteobacteria bacterium]
MFKIAEIIKRIKENHIGEYDQTDEYIFSNDRHLIPNFVRRMFRMKQIVPDRRKRRFGRIKAHIFHYITMPMLLITSGLLYVVIQNISTLLVFFNTNIYLNGIIVSLMIFGILRVYYNSYLLFRAASFLRQLEKVGGKENIEHGDVLKLRHDLENKGELLNTSSMEEVVDHIEKFGYLNITDNQARFIKSKLGYRASSNRLGVNFISGILVMLGLLGTFLGLLATIDSVGDALNSMANLGGDGGEIGMEQMTEFISSLAAPLQGMGLAFSSSLFGLSGSLLIGFFLHLAGTPQNFFIENVSRWIDDRIIKFDPKKLAEKAKEEDKKTEGAQADKPKKPEQAKATDRDLKDWLTGYVYLTTQTNKKLSDLTRSITSAGQGINEASQDLKLISGKHDRLLSAVIDLGAGFENIKAHADKIEVSVQDIQNLSHTMNSALTGIDISNNEIANALPNVASAVQAVDASVRDVGRSNQTISDVLPNVTGALEVIDDNNKRYTGALYKEVKTLADAQSGAGHNALSTIELGLQALEKQNNEIIRMKAAETAETQQVLKRLEATLSVLEKSQAQLARVVSDNAKVSHPSAPQKSAFSFFKKKKVANGDEPNDGDV